jgi:hypothetical protein
MKPFPAPAQPRREGFPRITLDELFEDYEKHRARRMRI